jgi:hypothetical protein
LIYLVSTIIASLLDLHRKVPILLARDDKMSLGSIETEHPVDGCSNNLV